MSYLHKKRDRKAESFTVTLGKIPHSHSYFYIKDTLNTGTKIKIDITEPSNTKEDQQQQQQTPLSILPSSPSKNNKNQKNSSSQKENNKNSNSTLTVKISKNSIGSKIIKEKNHPVELEDNLPNNNKNNNISINNVSINPIIQKAQPEMISLPSSTVKWLDINAIHEIEIKSLPEFFNNKYPSKTPEIYKKYRNFIINLYRQNPSTYLSGTACRRHLAGDVCAILRLHKFLEKWGLINFKLDPKFKPNSSFAPRTFNYKSPIYLDSASFLIERNNNSASTIIGNNNIVLTNKGKEIRTLYPINKVSENIFRSFLIGYNNQQNNNMNNSQLINWGNNQTGGGINNNNINKKIGNKRIPQINFLLKNYRPKCDLCEQLCSMDWYITKGNDFNELFNEPLIEESKEYQSNNNDQQNYLSSSFNNNNNNIINSN